MLEIFEKFSRKKENKAFLNEKKEVSPELKVSSILRKSIYYNGKELERKKMEKEDLRYVPVTSEDSRIQQLKKEEFNSEIDSLILSIEQDLISARNVSSEGIESKRHALITIKNELYSLKYQDLQIKAA